MNIVMYKKRYEFSIVNGLTYVYDHENDVHLAPSHSIEEALNGIESYEDGLAEAAWERSLQSGYTKGERTTS